ncbi:hypothetical protein DRO66_02095 [Candidatus Bathyarchaeota archaeon]|nr:MAG: hypothetical protein DRO66_02095 [Candidatus Bathyarchaeota archaeon]
MVEAGFLITPRHIYSHLSFKNEQQKAYLKNLRLVFDDVFRAVFVAVFASSLLVEGSVDL